MSKLKVNLTVVALLCAGLNGLMVGGIGALSLTKSDAAWAQSPAYQISERNTSNQELTLARQMLADGLRKLYQTNRDGGFTCYESSQAGFTCMNPA